MKITVTPSHPDKNVYESWVDAQRSGYRIFKDRGGEILLIGEDPAYVYCLDGAEGIIPEDTAYIAFPLTPLVDQDIILSNKD